jgi:hypothetical protein
VGKKPTLVAVQEFAMLSVDDLASLDEDDLAFES